MNKDSVQRFVWVSVFGIAMGFFEAAVVVYLRKLYYPDGFAFPLLALDEMDRTVLWVEVLREAFSIIMLAAVGVLAGRRGLERFFLFVLGFGVWDIFYYVFLFLILGWPPSLGTWDLLFLIPLPWVGPVWAPAAVALVFIATTVVFLIQEDRARPLRPTRWEWLFAIAGGLLVILSFCIDGTDIMEGASPSRFPWWWWALGMALALRAFLGATARANAQRRD